MVDENFNKVAPNSSTEHTLENIENIVPGDIITCKKTSDPEGNFKPFDRTALLVTTLLCDAKTPDKIVGIEALPIDVTNKKAAYNKYGSYDIRQKDLKNLMALPHNDSYQITFLKEPLFIENNAESLGTKDGDVKIHGSISQDLDHWPRLIGILEKRTKQNDFKPIKTKEIIPHEDTKFHIQSTLIRVETPTIEDVNNAKLENS